MTEKEFRNLQRLIDAGEPIPSNLKVSPEELRAATKKYGKALKKAKPSAPVYPLVNQKLADPPGPVITEEGFLADPGKEPKKVLPLSGWIIDQTETAPFPEEQKAGTTKKKSVGRPKKITSPVSFDPETPKTNILHPVEISLADRVKLVEANKYAVSKYEDAKSGKYAYMKLMYDYSKENNFELSMRLIRLNKDIGIEEGYLKPDPNRLGPNKDHPNRGVTNSEIKSGKVRIHVIPTKLGLKNPHLPYYKIGEDTPFIREPKITSKDKLAEDTARRIQKERDATQAKKDAKLEKVKKPKKGSIAKFAEKGLPWAKKIPGWGVGPIIGGVLSGTAAYFGGAEPAEAGRAFVEGFNPFDIGATPAGVGSDVVPDRKVAEQRAHIDSTIKDHYGFDLGKQRKQTKTDVYYGVKSKEHSVFDVFTLAEISELYVNALKEKERGAEEPTFLNINDNSGRMNYQSNP